MCPLDSTIGVVSALHLELAMMRRDVQSWRSVIGGNIRWSGVSPNTNLIRPWLDLHQNSPPIQLPSPNHHSYHYYHQPKPHDIHCCTYRAPQALHTFHVALLSSEFRWRCQVQSCARCWLQLVGCAALLIDVSNFGGPDSVGESGVKLRRSLR